MKPEKPVVFLTAGAAGMFCGSCMHDNALAKALSDLGEDCLLQPVYTPIRTDETSVATDNVFFGGIHVYLLQQFPLLRLVPRPLRRWLDWPPLIRFATRRAGATDPQKLGELAVSMLQGADGRQSEEVHRLVRWLADDLKPKAVVLSNLLIGGAIPEIRTALPEAKIIVMLQGDDIFLDHLPPEHATEAIRLCGTLGEDVDTFVVNSQFYLDKMSTRLSIDSGKFQVNPLTIDTSPYVRAELSHVHQRESKEVNEDGFRLGYLARVAPEKGFHRLVDAFIELANDQAHSELSLHVAGWLGATNEAYFDEQRRKIQLAGLAERFTYHGSPDIAGKVNFLSSVDLLSVPTEYEDPKGLFVLEANAAGVPVVQPAHGAFTELVASTGGGITIPPNDHDALVAAIADMKSRDEHRQHLGRRGRDTVHDKHAIKHAAAQLVSLWND